MFIQLLIGVDKSGIAEPRVMYQQVGKMIGENQKNF